MTTFAERRRMTRQEAEEALNEDSNMIAHLLENEDGTFSLMYHIVCEWCDFCDEQGDCRFSKGIAACKAKEDPYENQRQKEREVYE